MPASPDLVLLLRGAADRPQDLLGERTPLAYADLPNLRALSRRAALRPFDSAPSGHSVHEGGDLAAAFGLALDEGADLPAGALTALADDGPRGPCLRADPACVTITPDAAVVRNPADLALTEEEATALVASLNQELFEPDGARLVRTAAGDWLLYPATVPALRTVPLEGWVGADARGGLPTGADARPWQRLVNEVQMLLASHPVNQQRRIEGRLEVNTLWFWGSGDLPPAPTVPWHRVWGSAPLLAGFSRLAGLPHQSIGDQWSAVLEAAATDGPVLAVSDAPRQAAVAGDLGAKVAALERLDREWLGPLEGALAARKLGGAWLVLGPEAPTGGRVATPVPAAPLLACRPGRVWPWQRPRSVREQPLPGQPRAWADFPGFPRGR